MSTKTTKIKFRLVWPHYTKGPIIEATDLDDLAFELTQCFNVYENLNVFWPKKDMIVGEMESCGCPSWRWKEDPDKFPESIVNFFDAGGDWIDYEVLRYDESNQHYYWTDMHLEIIGGVE